MKVLVYNQQKDLRLSAQSAKSVVKDVLGAEGIKTDEISVYFVSTAEICRLHSDFFRDPFPTDCITFPMDGIDSAQEGYHILGEIFICPHTALDYLTAHPEEEVKSPYQETTLYLVHGLLHLLGYDDIEETNRLQMRAAEHRHMKRLISKNLLLTSFPTKHAKKTSTL